MRVIIKKDYEECSVWAANHITDAIKKFNPDEEKPFVCNLGLNRIYVYERKVFFWGRFPFLC